MVNTLVNKMNRKPALLLILPFALFLFPSSAHAEVNSLGDIEAVHILVESSSEDAKKCSVTEDGIKSAAEFPIATSQLKLVTMLETFIAYQIHVMVIAEDDFDLRRCTYSISISVNKSSLACDKVFWTKQMLGVTPKGGASTEIYNEIERLTKMFIVDWTKAKKR